MANEKRLIDANALVKKLELLANHEDSFRQSVILGVVHTVKAQPTVDALTLPYHPRPMLKDRNPFNTDVYCPECGTNLSGYYGGEPLPIVTCFNCGEILDPYKATTRTDGERKDNE